MDEYDRIATRYFDHDGKRYGVVVEMGYSPRHKVRLRRLALGSLSEGLPATIQGGLFRLTTFEVDPTPPGPE